MKFVTDRVKLPVRKGPHRDLATKKRMLATAALMSAVAKQKPEDRA